MRVRFIPVVLGVLLLARVVQGGDAILISMLMAGLGVALSLVILANYQRQKILCDARKKEKENEGG